MKQRIGLVRASYLRPRHRLAGVLVGLAVAFGLMFVGPALFGSIGVLVGIIPGFVLPFYLARRLGWKQLDHPAEMTLEDNTLTIPGLDVDGSTLTLTPADVRSGIESMAQQSVLLDLVNKRRVHLHLTSAASDGERILTALGVGPAQRTTEVPLRRTLGAFSIGLLTFLTTLVLALFAVGPLKGSLGLSLGAAMVVASTMATLLTLVLVRRFGSPHVVVGNDGLQIHGLLRQEFIPYAKIKSVEQQLPTGDDPPGMFSVVLRLTNGSRRVLPMVAIDRAWISGLVERIQRETQKVKGEGRVRITDALTRGGKSLAEWREELTRLATRQASFRQATFERDEIEQVLADPNASREQRIGAAYVLHRIDPEVGKERVRVAAEATAAEDLRDALQEAGEGEIESARIERTLRA